MRGRRDSRCRCGRCSGSRRFLPWPRTLDGPPKRNDGNQCGGPGDREGMKRSTTSLAPPPAAVRDHDDAFVAFYERWRTPLVRLATLLVDRVEVAEEVVQDAM